MQKKLAALLLTTTLFLGFPSCKDDSIDCSIQGEYFDIKGISIRNYKGKEQDFENGRNVNPIEDGETIPFEYFLIRNFFDVEYYSEDQAFINFDFTNKAYALSCAEEDGYMGTKEKLDTLFLITNSDYNEHYSAGDTINEIVKASAPYSFWKVDDFLPLSDYVNNAQEKIEYEWFQMKLIEEPTFKDLSHSFTLIYLLQNGEVYTAQTETIKFE